MDKQTIIWWIRRDLRLNDNQALSAAAAYGGHVIPLFILDPALWQSRYVGSKRIAFLLAGLRLLDADLRQRGGRLIVRRGDPLVELSAVLRSTGATAVFAEEDVSPYARQRDARVAAALPLKLFAGLTVHAPGLVRKQDGDPYTVFTPFSKAWKALAPPQETDILAAPARIVVPEDVTSVPIPEEPRLPDTVPFEAGEAAAQTLLASFVSGDHPPVFRYAEQRNQLDLAGTSMLSPYLRFGMMSPRQTAVAALQSVERAPHNEARKGAGTWLNELIWREFYMNILYHFPHVRRGSFRPQYDHIEWENDSVQLRAWQTGQTGYPVIDAAMRQLGEMGWMHNRARMITASFLVKDLLVDWRLGEEWFMKHLVDGDPAANNGGWQWTAGVGTDAAPYFRIFNPILQSKKFDPHGVYIRRWLPELANVPDQAIHEPWEMSLAVQRAAGCVIGRDYPAPIIDRRETRERTLARYQAVSS